MLTVTWMCIKSRVSLVFLKMNSGILSHMLATQLSDCWWPENVKTKPWSQKRSWCNPSPLLSLGMYHWRGLWEGKVLPLWHTRLQVSPLQSNRCGNWTSVIFLCTIQCSLKCTISQVCHFHTRWLPGSWGFTSTALQCAYKCNWSVLFVNAVLWASHERTACVKVK